MTQDLSWTDAIKRALVDEKEGLYYTDITAKIFSLGLRNPTTSGATPNSTVSAQLSIEIKKKDSQIVKLSRGLFTLKEYTSITQAGNTQNEDNEDDKNVKIIHAFGLYWNRDYVNWSPTQPDLFGVEQYKSNPINFKDQIGIYLLYDHREIIYIGQAIKRTLGQRLQEHTLGRLNGRWNRFSWFGFYPVNKDGNLNISDVNFSNINIENVGDELESMLIEIIEPRQNRKRGNLFGDCEYLQKEDPKIEEQREDDLFEKIKQRRKPQ